MQDIYEGLISLRGTISVKQYPSASLKIIFIQKDHRDTELEALLERLSYSMHGYDNPLYEIRTLQGNHLFAIGFERSITRIGFGVSEK